LALATAPQSLSVSGLSSTEATLNWSAPADNGGSSIASYVIEVSRDQGASWSRVIGVASTQTSARVGGMTAGTSYLYRVSAFTKPGKGESAQISLATPAVVASKPTSLKVSAIGTTDLTLSWTLPASNGGSAITDYKVEMSSNDGATWTAVSHAASKNLALKITGLPEGTKRLFRVSAINGVGTSDSSAVISGTTLGNVPDAPTSLRVASKTSTTVTITWSQTQVVGGSPVRGFVIEFSRDGGSTWAIAKSAVTKNLSSVISGFKSGTNYKIRVRAINDVGSSAASSFVSVTTR